jgi:hypothetical protein
MPRTICSAAGFGLLLLATPLADAGPYADFARDLAGSLGYEAGRGVDVLRASLPSGSTLGGWVDRALDAVADEGADTFRTCWEPPTAACEPALARFVNELGRPATWYVQDQIDDVLP